MHIFIYILDIRANPDIKVLPDLLGIYLDVAGPPIS
jgi:hypothetical protein